MPAPPLTVSIAFVRGMLGGVGATSAVAQELLAAVGIAPARLAEGAARVTAAQYAELFRRLAERLDDEGLGFYTRPLRRGSFALLCRAMLGAPSMQVALHRLARAFGVLQDDLRLAVVQDGELSGLQVIDETPRFTARRMFMHEALLRVLSRQIVWLHGARLKVRRFDFAYARPAHAAEYARAFPGELRFARARSALWFDSAALAAPPRRDDAALRAFLRQATALIIVPQGGERTVAARVRAHLQQHAQGARWPALHDCAAALQTAVSTLQRHLAAEGTSFQSVKDQLRRDLAIERLSSSTRPLAELAGELGFADSAAFQRAFKAWTGSAPGAYRGGR